MNSYKDALINDKNGSRYAGRVWTDKSVFAAGENSSSDGVKWSNNILSFGNNSNENEWQVETSDDFLNVFSAVTANQQIIQQQRAPLDIVLVLDMSGSMGNSVGNNKSRIEQAADAINNVLEEISKMDGARVGLQVYSSLGSYFGTQYAGFKTVFKLDHYTKYNNSNYLTVSNQWNGDYKVTFRAQPSSGQAINQSINSTGGTTTQMGIYQGMKMLAEATNVNQDDNGEIQHRTPVMILITDGVPTYIANSNWWAPTLTQESQQLGDGSNNADGLNFTTMLTAAYMKKVVNKHYYGNENGKDGRTARIYTISVDTDKQYEDIMESTFNPKEKWGSDSNMSKALKKYWESYEKKESNFSVTVCSSTSCRNNRTFTINHPPTNTTDGISELTENDMKYNNAYYDVESANLQEIFGNIITSLQGEIYNPIEGTNSAGVSNSLTFADPIGLYMEVKDKAIAVNNPVEESEDIENGHGTYDMALLLYNKMHGIVKTAVYDESFIKKHSDFKSGWYDSSGKKLEEGKGSWTNGDTYYVDRQTATQYVPTIPENSSSEDKEDLKHIVYTLYRFAEEQGERNTTISNPCYGENAEVTFKLSDIRIWVEESDNYVNQSGMTIPGTGYDSMLYVNIPSAAIPSEVAKITLDEEGNIAKYSTNINSNGITTPLRLFYSVGIKDELLTEDNLDMDLTKVSQEYIEHYKNDDGSLKFFDNYWSGSTYDDYDNGPDRARGDSALTFSPNKNNRYYFFQKNLTLYTDAYYIKSDGTIEHIDDLNKYENKTLSKICDGKTENNDISKEKKDEITKEIESGKIAKDTIIVLKDDTITDEQSYKNNGYYYIIDDYYAPNGTDNKGKKVEIVIQRSGQDLSLGNEGESSKKGEYLCWIDSTGQDTNIHDFNQKPSDNNDKKWVLATKVGALRAGNLSSNIGTKTNNKTQTANNYYIPTISASEDNTDTVITNYLGNNGRLTAEDTLIMITKELEGTLETEEDDKFTFEVNIEGKEGDYQGVIVKKHNTESGVHWDYIIDKVEVIIDQEGYLLAPNDEKATIEHNGQKVNMKIHSDQSNQNNMSVYATEENNDGTQKFYVTVDYYNESSSGSSIATSQKVYVWETVTGDTENGNENKVGEKFKTKSTYKTETIKFGYKTDETKEAKYPEGWTEEDKKLNPYTAKITLKPDEGLIINGIKSGADYKVTEIITKNQDISGVNFKSIEHKMNSSTTKYDQNSTNTENSPGNGANGFHKDETKEDKKYMVFGDTGSKIEEIHYTNYDKLKHLTISKNLEPEEGTKITDHDKNVEFTFKISFEDLQGKPLNNEIEYKIIKITDKLTEGEFKKLQLKGTEGEQFEFKLKADEQIIFDKLPLQTGYKYQLMEEETDGYKSETSTINGTVEANSNGVVPQTIKNIKLIPKVKVNLTGTKNLVGGILKQNEFEFTLTPAKGNPKEDPITKEKTIKNEVNGELKFIDDEYTTKGEYNYTIEEKNTKEKGIIYDTTKYNVKVTISEDEEEKLVSNIEITSSNSTTDDSSTESDTIDDTNDSENNEANETDNDTTEHNTNEKEIVFNNIRVDKSVDIQGTKQLINSTLEDEQFKFSITPDKNNPENDILSEKKTVTNDNNGNIKILDGTYTNIGEYKYYIKEEIPEIRNSIIYDTTQYVLTITVAVDENNNITSKTTITSNGETKEAIIFKNVYVNEKVNLTGQKYLIGKDLTEGQFKFSIEPAEENPKDDPIKKQEVTNKADGSINLIDATYQNTGTYKYHVKEIIPNTEEDTPNDEVDSEDDSTPEEDNNSEGETNPETQLDPEKETNPKEKDYIKYDDTEYDITIEVKEENGIITHNIKITKNDEEVQKIEFTNYYIDTKIHLEGIKHLENGKLVENQFSFIITPDTSNNPENDILKEATTVTNDADGKIKFFDGKYTEPGTYKYTIKEVIPEDIGNIEYDKTEYEVTITIGTNNGEIIKNIEIKSNDETTNTISFTNIVQNIDFKLNGNKIIVGNSSTRNFDFIISPDQTNPDGDIIDEQTIVSNDNNGIINFLDGQYTKVGTYKYHIQEVIPNDPLNIHYDDTTYDVIVNLSIKDNIVNKDITITNSNNEVTDNIVFTNIVKSINVTLNGYKKLIGDTLLDKQFRFSITPYETNPEDDPIKDILYVENNADGEIPLISETYTSAGVYKYKIQEVVNNNDTIDFDNTTYEATILITEETPGLLTSSITIKTLNSDISREDIVFVNTTKNLLPNTYDNIIKIIYTLISTISILCIVIYIQNKILKEAQ